jgi:peptidyl-prolyl cis-trans isomerase D
MKGIALGITILIGAVFAFSGTGALMVPGMGSEAAILVNGTAVSELEVLRAISRQKQRILSENEGLDPSVLEDELIRPNAIQQLIGLQVLIQEAEKQRMSVSEADINNLIIESEAFQSDGSFDQDTYRYMLQSGGYTSSTYKGLVRSDLITQQLVAGVSDTNFVTETELAGLAAITEQTRDFYYLTIPAAPIRETIDIPEEQLKEYYNSNRGSYMTEPLASVEYIELNPSKVADPALINEEIVKERFNEELSNLDIAESRQAAHILLSDPDENLLAEVQRKIDAGEDFSLLASEYSEDFGSAEIGGELGFSSGDTFPDEFETALSSLEIGEISGAVRTDAGTHFIKLISIQQQTFSFDEERERITEELMRDATSDLLVEKLELMKELSFNADSLADVAEDVGLALEKTELFSRGGGTGVAAIPDVISASFSSEVLDDGYASEVLELGDDRYLVLKLAEYVDARQLELAEVSDRVRQSLTEEILQELMQDKGSRVLEELRAGDSIESVAKAGDYEWQVGLSVSRRSQEIDQEITSRVFSMPSPDSDVVSDSFYLNNGDLMVASLSKVNSGSLAAAPKEVIVSLTDALELIGSNRDMQAFQQTLINQADIIQ